MIKIKKLYIENFKGIKSGLTIDLNKDAELMTILSGPNGFGKTTVFDTLDICLTGQLHRFKKDEPFDQVQKKTTGRSKPYYQNQDGHDVVLKLLIEDDSKNKSYVIIKHYDDIAGVDRIDAAKSNIPHESNQFFKTYLTDKIEYFNDSDYSELDMVGQNEINKLFFEDSTDFKLDSTYYLFNYLQQEENIYFLKKNEDLKGDSLSFLFNIVDEESKKNKLLEILNNLNNQANILYSNQKSIEKTISSSNEVEYLKLFEAKDFEFDKEYPFNESLEKEKKRDLLNDELDILIEFRGKFSPSEFQKFTRYNYVNKNLIADKELIESLLLKNIYSEEILQEIISNNEKINKISSLNNLTNRTLIKEEIFSWLIKDNYNEVFLRYTKEVDALEQIDRELGEIGKIITALLSSRDEALKKFNSLIEKELIENNNCPMCNTPFGSYKELIDSITDKTEALKSFQKTKIEQRDEIIKRIDLIVEELKEAAKLFLDNNKIISNSILSILRSVSNHLNLFSNILSGLPEIESLETEELFFTKVPDEKDLNTNVGKFINFLVEKVLPKYKYNELSILNREIYSNYFDNQESNFNSCTIELLNKKKDYINLQYSLEVNKDLYFLKKRAEKLEEIRVKTKEIYDKLHVTIQLHKKQMIEKIKIPFYIYSGKILQSYQQGLGIFIDIRKTGQSNKVWFKTGNSSDHDIVYHLSSGQMAVVSIAFCLSLNKVFNTNKNFQFLAIDDPIQTLDDLNVHTFIELLRHDFSDYQMLLSTHDDFTSKYIKYKFEKFDLKTSIKNMQQLVLEQLN